MLARGVYLILSGREMVIVTRPNNFQNHPLLKLTSIATSSHYNKEKICCHVQQSGAGDKKNPIYPALLLGNCPCYGSKTYAWLCADELLVKSCSSNHAVRIRRLPECGCLARSLALLYHPLNELDNV